VWRWLPTGRSCRMFATSCSACWVLVADCVQVGGVTGKFPHSL
jgi:hypothetical protein